VSLCRADKVLLGGCAAIVGSAVAFGPNVVGLGLPASVLATVLADGIFRATSSTLYPTIAHGPRSSHRVALTFDDGPDPEVTPRVLDVLNRHSARATFFMIGRNLERSMTVGERVVREGHEIGNHSWQHGYMQNVYPVRVQLMDMERNEALIRDLTKSEVRSHYRAPVGLKSPRFARAAHRLNLKVVAWSVHSRDTIDSNPERIARRVLARIRPGDIVLMHDGHQTPGARRTSALIALPLVLEGLRRAKLEPVTLRELLA
jgi:peptidoglycan-N-acetylglucosamine deacetylase